MRLWHKSMIEFLPDMQLKGQWRECALIAHELKEHGTPNHLLVNRVTEYSVDDFYSYCISVYSEIKRRDFNCSNQSLEKIWELDGKIRPFELVFYGWHNKEYLRVCMANLYEKHVFGVGKSRISDDEWQTLLDGYKQITGEDYVI